MSVITLNKDNFDIEVLQSDKPVLVDFAATWCGPCQMMAPIIHKLAEENDDYKFCSLDTDSCPEIAQKYGIHYLPTLILFNKGDAVDTSVGLVSEDEILAMFSKI